MRNRQRVPCFLIWAVLFASEWHVLAQSNQGMQTQTGSWMQVADNPTIALPVFTAECWVRFRSGGLVVTRDHSSGTPSDWQLWYEGSAQRLAFITAKSPPDSYFYTPVNSILPNEWYHIALVVNGPAGWARVYVDGVLLISPTFSSRNFSANTGLAWGGYFSNSSGAYLRADFDECRYWNVTRNLVEIAAAMNTPLAPDDRAGLVGYWRFCNGYADSSGNGNHGQPQNTTLVELPELPDLSCCPQHATRPDGIVIQGTPRFCEGESRVLSAITGYVRYLWSTGQTTRSIEADTSGVYSVTMFDNSGCGVTSTVVLERILSVPPVITGPVIFCEGDTACLEVPGPYSDIRWSTGGTGKSLCVTAEGRYSVSAIDTNGCAVTSKEYVLHRLGGEKRTAGNRATMLIPVGQGTTIPFLIDPPYPTGTSFHAEVEVQFDTALIAGVRMETSPSVCWAGTSNVVYDPGFARIVIDGVVADTSAALFRIALEPRVIAASTTTQLTYSVRITGGCDGAWSVAHTPLHVDGYCEHLFRRTKDIRVQAAPNPASGRASISVYAADAGAMALALVDAFGRVRINIFEGLLEAGGGTFSIDVSTLASGRYLIIARTPEGVHVKDFAIVR